MSQILELLKSAIDYGDANLVTYVPHDFRDVQVMVGVPPVPIHGLEYVFTQHINPQNTFHSSLGGGGVRNRNTTGIIEFAVLQNSLASAKLTALELTQIAWPVFVVDRAVTPYGLNTWFGDKCKRVGTPQDRKGRFPDLEIYTFQAARLTIARASREVV